MSAVTHCSKLLDGQNTHTFRSKRKKAHIEAPVFLNNNRNNSTPYSVVILKQQSVHEGKGKFAIEPTCSKLLGEIPPLQYLKKLKS